MMIQDIAPLQLNNQYQMRQPMPSDYILGFRGNAVCAGTYRQAKRPDEKNAQPDVTGGGIAGRAAADVAGGGIAGRAALETADRLGFPTYGQLQAWCIAQACPLPSLIYLFEISGSAYFLADLPDGFAEPETGGAETMAEHGAGADGHGQAVCSGALYTYVRMFDIRRMKPKEQVLAAATAWHLYIWYRDNRFCGRCGRPLAHSGTMRMLSCPACGNQVFPKIAPAVIVGVTDGERILMTTYANREYKRYALIAGFTEIGETAEETVRREVYEEVGLRVKNIRYYKSQPWGFDSNLLLGYFCELDDTHEIRLDEEELATAEWVHYSGIEDDTEGLSLTREMMTAFRDGMRKRESAFVTFHTYASQPVPSG